MPPSTANREGEGREAEPCCLRFLAVARMVPGVCCFHAQQRAPAGAGGISRDSPALRSGRPQTTLLTNERARRRKGQGCHERPAGRARVAASGGGSLLLSTLAGLPVGLPAPEGDCKQTGRAGGRQGARVPLRLATQVGTAGWATQKQQGAQKHSRRATCGTHQSHRVRRYGSRGSWRGGNKHDSFKSGLHDGHLSVTVGQACRRGGSSRYCLQGMVSQV